MSGWTVPPSAAVPPGTGLAPPPNLAVTPRPDDADDEITWETRARWAEAAAEADHEKSSEELRRDAERTRERLSRDVAELRHKLGLEDGAGLGHMAAVRPFGPVRRHPFTVVVAAAGATTATLIGFKIARGHRKDAKRYMKVATDQRKLARRRFLEARDAVVDAKDAVVSAASDLPQLKRPHLRRRSGLRRLVHR